MTDIDELLVMTQSYKLSHLQMQMQSLRRELSSGVRPLHETFVALVRAFAKKGLSTRAMEILAAMEKYKYDIRKAWLILVGMEINLCCIFYLLGIS